MADHAVSDRKRHHDADPARVAAPAIGFADAAHVTTLDRHADTLNASARVLSLKALGTRLATRSAPVAQRVLASATTLSRREIGDTEAAVVSVPATPLRIAARAPSGLAPVQRVKISIAPYIRGTPLPEAWVEAYREDLGPKISKGDAAERLLALLRQTGGDIPDRYAKLNVAIGPGALPASGSASAVGPAPSIASSSSGDKTASSSSGDKAASSSSSGSKDPAQEQQESPAAPLSEADQRKRAGIFEIMREAGLDPAGVRLLGLEQSELNCHSYTFSKDVDITTIPGFLKEWSNAKPNVLMCLAKGTDVVAHSATKDGGRWRQKLKNTPEFTSDLAALQAIYDCIELPREMRKVKALGEDVQSAFHNHTRKVFEQVARVSRDLQGEKKKEVHQLCAKIRELRPADNSAEGTLTLLEGQLEDLLKIEIEPLKG